MMMFPSSSSSWILSACLLLLLAKESLAQTTTTTTTATTTMTWEPRASYDSSADASLGRHHPIVFANETHAFLLGGSLLQNDAANDFYMYDEANDTWSSLDAISPFPGTPRSYGYGVVLSQTNHPKAYIGFGSSVAGERLSDLWEFDMSSLVWKPLASCPGLGRRHPSMVPVYTSGGKWELHVGLGDGLLPQGQVFSNFNDYWSYDITSDVWTQLPDFPSSQRHHPFFFGMADQSYVGLGHSDGTNPYIERDFYSYSTTLQAWTRQPDLEAYSVPLEETDATPVLTTTEARVAGTEFSMEFPLVGQDAANSELMGAIGFVLSGDGDDHNAMPEGEFLAFYPPNSPLTIPSTTTSISRQQQSSNPSAAAWWRQLPSHPGPSRWAPGSFVMRGTARVYFTSGYDRLNQILHSDVWTIDLSPLFQKQTTTATSTTTTATTTAITNTTTSVVNSSTTEEEDTFTAVDYQSSSAVSTTGPVIMTSLLFAGISMGLVMFGV